MAPRDLDRLATAARKRRHDLGLALNDKNAKAAGTSKGTWQRVERGEGIRPTNYTKIDGLLQWAPGSCRAIINGGEPMESRPLEGDPGVMISKLPPEALDEQARNVVKLAAIATTGGLTSDEIKALSNKVVADLRANGIL
ncbi:hypothetical protein ACIQ1S_09795 [Streptomyces griseus]|uniref:hypothetical protein n=1 Tax=Streptomyces griseus TaxID=1911 RepID=UPI00382321A1